jgi:hypothetical protein
MGSKSRERPYGPEKNCDGKFPQLWARLRPHDLVDSEARMIDLPPEVGRRFVEDMRAHFAEPNAINRDEIAARQAWLVVQANQRASLPRECGFCLRLLFGVGFERRSASQMIDLSRNCRVNVVRRFTS